MTPQGDEVSELWYNVTLFGGIIFVLLVVGIWLLGVRWRTNRKIEKGEIVKQLYNEKERKNGQSKGGARGHF